MQYPAVTMNYFTNELAFDLPPLPFSDETVTLLEAPLEEGRSFTLVVQRFPMPPARSLREIVEEHATRAHTTLPSHSILFQRDGEIGGCPAIELGIRWKGEEALVYTRQAFVEAGEQWMLIAGNAELVDREICDQAVSHVLSSVRFRS